MIERSGLMMNHKKLSRLYREEGLSVRRRRGGKRARGGGTPAHRAHFMQRLNLWPLTELIQFRTDGRDQGFVPSGLRRDRAAPTLATLHPIFTPLLHRWIDFGAATCHIAMEEIRTTGR
ncbi:hypothetical protein EDF58_1172 [Novosphingobium sp. PhB57]|nr:hypothetical protein EDF58_1172 [Novosphingobium sp. PhB57]